MFSNARVPDEFFPSDPITLAEAALLRKYSCANSLARAIRNGTARLTVYESAGRYYLSRAEVLRVPARDPGAVRQRAGHGATILAPAAA